jgi:GAF domain-containing protein
MSNTAELRGMSDEGSSLIQAQYEASSTIYGSNDPAEILEAFMSFMQAGFSQGHLALVEDDLATVSIIALADSDGVRPTKQYRRLDEYPAYDTLPAVEIINIEDVTTDAFLNDAERERLTEQDIRALILIPLVVGQRLIGVLAFWHSDIASVSNARLRALRSLADQAAVVFENQALLRNTETSLEEVRTLYDINRALLSAQDVLAMLRLLRQYLAPNSASILYITVEQDNEGIQRGILRHTLLPDSEQMVNTPVAGIANDDMGGANVIFSEDENAETVNPLHMALRAPYNGSYALLVIRERDQIKDLIAVTFSQPMAFDTRIRRLYFAVADQITIVLQNQRLLRDAQVYAIQLSRQVRVLQTLNRLTIGIGSFRDEQALLDYAVEAMTDALDADHGGVLVFDTKAEYGTVMSEYPPTGTVGVRLDMRSNALFEAFRADVGKPLAVYNVEVDSRVTPETLEVFRRMNIQSLMMVPIVLEGQLVASIGLDLYTKERQFTPEIVELAHTMGVQVGIALQNIRLLIDAQHRADQLQRIASFSQSVQATLDMEALLTIMLNESRQMFRLDRMSIALYDPEKNELYIVAQYEDEKPQITLEGGTILPLGSYTVVGDVWETGQPVYIADVEEASDIRRAQFAVVRSLMIAPIRARGRLIGTLHVGNNQPHAYSETDFALFQQVSVQFAIALENSEAYAQSQRAAKNQALVNEITAQLQRDSDIQRMMEVALESLGRALGAQRARARLATQADGDSNGAE